MTDDIKAKAIALHDAFTHGHGDRRAFLREMALLAGSVAAAEALIASIGADPAAAAIVPADDKRLKTEILHWKLKSGRQMSGYAAEPISAKSPPPVVVVIHENRGLNEHIRDVARRMALAGFSAFAPDFLAHMGGTPSDEDKARQMIGALDMPATIADGVELVGALRSFERGAAAGTRSVGVTGFCWGGAMVNQIAIGAGEKLGAGVSYYGRGGDPADAPRVGAPLMLHLAGNDARVNETAKPWAEALKAAGKQVIVHEYPGVEHAFNNDTSAARYNAEAAKLAWGRTIAFFKQQLSGQ